MIAAQLDKEGRAVTDVTAADAVIDIYRRPGVILLKLAMEDAVSYDGVQDLCGYAEPTHAIPIPSPEMGEPGAMTYSELLHVRDHPQAYPQVDRIRESIAQILGDVDLSRTLDETVGAEGAIELVQPGPMNRSYLVRADQVVNNRFRNSDGSAVEVTEMSDGEPSRRFRCRVAQLVSLPAMGIQSKQFNLELLDLVVEDLPAAIRPTPASGSSFPMSRFRPWTRSTMRHAAGGRGGHRLAVEPKSRQLTNRLNYLDSKIAGLERQVISRLNRRYALSVTACLLLVLGAVLAMLMRHALPLSVYMWAFLPALLDLVLISSGSSMIRAGSVAVGLVIMWSGNGLLLCMLLACYARLSRH